MAFGKMQYILGYFPQHGVVTALGDTILKFLITRWIQFERKGGRWGNNEILLAGTPAKVHSIQKPCWL